MCGASERKNVAAGLAEPLRYKREQFKRVNSGKSGGSELCFAACGLLRGFDHYFHREVVTEPIVDAFFLTGVYYPLPADIASTFIVFSDNVRVSRQDGYDRILPDSSTVVRIVDNLALHHDPHCNRR
jgi:hypothetical protein